MNPKIPITQQGKINNVWHPNKDYKTYKEGGNHNPWMTQCWTSGQGRTSVMKTAFHMFKKLGPYMESIKKK